MAHRILIRLGKCGVSYVSRRSSLSQPQVFLQLQKSSRSLPACMYSNQAETAVKNEGSEKPGHAGKHTHEFQAETRMLLDMMAKSLYSDKEVFIRELISNSSDAIEKLRYKAVTQGKPLPDGLISISTDKQNRTITFKDSGIGMSKEELISNLGTIARSGSKAFLEELQQKGQSALSESSNIIGQFGVGFYSSFMVAEKVEVYTKSYVENSVGYKWSCDGSGTYDIEEAPGVQQGTEIKIYLKVDCREFADEQTVKDIIKKYSNFVGSPVQVNGTQVNTIQPLWLKDPKDIQPEQHLEFYRFISFAYDKPRFTLHYRTDSPLMINALLYFPESKPDLFQLSRESDSGVALYCRKVLIQSKAESLLPKWLRFIKGVVDSEDIPLNLSRELLQNSALIAKLRNVLTARVIKFLGEKLSKERSEYEKFHNDYSIFLKEGILTSANVLEREDIAKLLLFEFSNSPGEKHTLTDYVNNMKGNERKIFYLNAPNRELAEASPYYESIKKKNVDVIFCYERYDEMIFSHLMEFKKCKLVSLESDIREDKESAAADSDLKEIIGDVNNVEKWFKTTLKGKVYTVKTTQRLEKHPCVVTVEEMAAARQFIRNQQNSSFTEESKYSLLQPRLEINPKHPIIKKLSKLITSDPKLAELLAKQLFVNAMVQAGLIEDSRTVLLGMNELLTLALDKH
ncbi:UNVERIFIED_CONTAM: hypothetical protein PYX00_005661 [Menopon gallinae]|uniref:Heat shock protein 75 kDa, mitochondrial n=1 Tax=Menopon gallinae TaxID=328185 RepID=A0AAW2HST3_9NEOP